MQVVNLNFYRDPKQPANTNILKELAKEHLLDKGGEIAFNWSMQQCGSTIWYDLKGYIGDSVCVCIRYNWL